MRQSIPWQLLLLISSLLLALSLAIGGWALGRWRSHEHAATEKPTPPRSTVPIEPAAAKPVAVPDARGSIQLDPASAALIGDIKPAQIGDGDSLVGWSSVQDKATWQFRAQRPGFFNAELTYSTSSAAADAELELRIGDRKRLCSLRSSGGLDQFITDEYPVAVPSSGVHQVTIQPHSNVGGQWLALRSVRLIPTKPDKATSAP